MCTWELDGEGPLTGRAHTDSAVGWLSPELSAAPSALRRRLHHRLLMSKAEGGREPNVQARAGQELPSPELPAPNTHPFGHRAPLCQATEQKSSGLFESKGEKITLASSAVSRAIVASAPVTAQPRLCPRTPSPGGSDQVPRGPRGAFYPVPWMQVGQGTHAGPWDYFFPEIHWSTWAVFQSTWLWGFLAPSCLVPAGPLLPSLSGSFFLSRSCCLVPAGKLAGTPGCKVRSLSWANLHQKPTGCSLN